MIKTKASKSAPSCRYKTNVSQGIARGKLSKLKHLVVSLTVLTCNFRKLKYSLRKKSEGLVNNPKHKYYAYCVGN